MHPKIAISAAAEFAEELKIHILHTVESGEKMNGEITVPTSK